MKGGSSNLSTLQSINFWRNSFIEKSTSFYRLPFDDSDEYRMDYKLANFIDLPERKQVLSNYMNNYQQWIDDDLMNIYMTVGENTVSYNVQRYRLKKIEDLNVEHKPSMYHRGDYKDYDWEVISYVYTI